MVVEEKTFSRIERSYGCHIFVGERKIKNVDILPHPFDVGRFGNDNHAALDKPAQSDLGYALAVFTADFGQQRIRKETVASFGERSPRHDARTELLHDPLRLDLLVENMRLYLIHGRNDLHITGQIDEVVGIEIRNADSTQFTLFVSLFQCAVCPVTAIQNRYSMMARRHETLFPVLEELGVGFVAFSPLANGLLSTRYTAETTFDPATDYRASMPQYHRESFVKNRPLFALLERLADEHRATAAQISLAWMINKRPWIVPIPGTRCLCRLKENIGAADVHLSADEVRAIDAELDTMEMSEVFGGSPVIDKPKNERKQ